MILKKPYAFFIKIFKPLHLVLGIIILYSIILNNKILEFLNTYLHTSSSVVGQNIQSTYINSLIFIIPVIIIVLSMIILGIMFRKKKPISFYLICIFAFIFVLIINVYTSNFLKMLESSILAIKSIKLIHDLVLINIMLQSIIMIFFITRGMGLNFKKFDFNSDLSKFDISESDKEEFEVSVNIDLDESKRLRKEKIRNIKYFYVENRFKINLGLIIIVLVSSIVGIYAFFGINKSKNVEGITYSISNFNIKVDKTTILDKDYLGNKFSSSDDVLIALNVELSSNIENKNLSLSNFYLNIDSTKFKPTIKYNNRLIDLGNVYSEDTLNKEAKNYILAYQIPYKYVNSSMKLSYKNLEDSIDISLNPKYMEDKSNTIVKKLGDEISFEDTLGDIKFKIDNYEIGKKFLVNYNFCLTGNNCSQNCIQDGSCISSREYLTPSIDTNYKKEVLKLDVNFSNNSEISSTNFYTFLNKFGSISYKIGDTWNIEAGNFEYIESKKTNTKSMHIGINSAVSGADEIKLVFNIRDYRYEYILK